LKSHLLAFQVPNSKHWSGSRWVGWTSKKVAWYTPFVYVRNIQSFYGIHKNIALGNKPLVEEKAISVTQFIVHCC